MPNRCQGVKYKTKQNVKRIKIGVVIPMKGDTGKDEREGWVGHATPKYQGSRIELVL